MSLGIIHVICAGVQIKLEMKEWTMRNLFLSGLFAFTLFASTLSAAVHAYEWCPEDERSFLRAQTGVIAGTQWIDRINCVKTLPNGYIGNTCGVWVLVHSCILPRYKQYDPGGFSCPKLIGDGANKIPSVQLERVFWLGPYETGVTFAWDIHRWWAVSCE